MSDNHYDLPWRAVHMPRRSWREWQMKTCLGGLVADRLSHDGAKIIVRAVNNHHALIAALEAALPHITSGIVCNQVAAALAKAKETP